jgi:AraC-like DNA-binding protein
MTVKGKSGVKLFSRLLDQEEGIFQQLGTEGVSHPKVILRNLEFPGIQGAEYLSDAIYYCHAKMIPDHRPYAIHVLSQKNYIQLSFCLAGHLNYFNNKTGKLIYSLSSGMANMIFYGDQEIRVEYEGEEVFETLVVNIHIDYIQKHFSKIFLGLGTLLRDISGNEPRLISEKGILVSPELRQLLLHFVSKKYAGCFLAHYVEIKIKEAFILLMDSLEEKDSYPTTAQFLKPEDIEKMELAKSILLENFSNPPGLKELALLVGTNEFNLKKHFKLHFGKTAYNYLHEFKMEKARELLASSKKPIADIAEYFGYSHATHFSSAFKKSFGMLPKAYRESNSF